MGLWAWTINQMLTPKFWTLVKRDGFMQTYLRNHRASRSSHYAGGTLGPVKCVGMDAMGNRYYEDFDVVHRGQRRWVEYSDYFMSLGITGDRVPPAWHGWLAHQYDDYPKTTGNDKSFYEPISQKPHQELLSGTPKHFLPQGAPEDLNRMEYLISQQNKRATKWTPNIEDGQSEGKKLIKKPSNAYEDILANKE